MSARIEEGYSPGEARRIVFAMRTVYSLMLAATFACCLPAVVHAAPVKIAIERPGKRGRFVQLDFDPAAAPLQLSGCQTSARDKRCTRRRSRIPLTVGQRQTIISWWRVIKTRCKKRLPRGKRTGRLWAQSGSDSFEATLPARHDDLRLRQACRLRARLGWYLLRRYDRKPLAPPMRPPSASRRCKRDKDCVIAYRPCGYGRTASCTTRWKQAVNVAADRRFRKTWSIKVPACSRRRCPKGAKGRWLGTKAVCVAGQCSIR
jgi:hypothetical protein